MQCARYAFGFSGVTDEDEAADTPGLRNVTPTERPQANPFEKGRKAIGKPADAPKPDPEDAEPAKGAPAYLADETDELPI